MYPGKRCCSPWATSEGGTNCADSLAAALGFNSRGCGFRAPRVMDRRRGLRHLLDRRGCLGTWRRCRQSQILQMVVAVEPRGRTRAQLSPPTGPGAGMNWLRRGIGGQYLRLTLSVTKWEGFGPLVSRLEGRSFGAPLCGALRGSCGV